ncbi:hypothetical protein [Saccharopolyspora spinosa]|uniref:Uncharacterized protein n=1 Tax=Saccharopolyspora spinosa TaxID=60894 RepID=A0A2N3Y0V7_SACSN|nr:hypothetical protein [Saccharopolyspora spinosa]PKW16540.1 hypothetical protein A8926_4382 [Saccharopolyspora spinosa]
MTGAAVKWLRYNDITDTWSQPQTIQGVTSSAVPAIGDFPSQNQLWCVYPGDNYVLSWVTYDIDIGWSTPHQHSSLRLSEFDIESYGDELWYLRSTLPEETGEPIFGASKDALMWSDEAQIGSGQWKPAVARAGSYMYSVHLGSTNALQWMRYDGQSWSPSVNFPSGFPGCGHDPGLAVYKNDPHCAYNALNGGVPIQWCRFDGNEWGNLQDIPNTGTDARPVLASTYTGKLVCVYTDFYDSATLYWTVFDGNAWFDKPKRIDSVTDAQPGPSIATFQGTVYCTYLAESA